MKTKIIFIAAFLIFELLSFGQEAINSKSSCVLTIRDGKNNNEPLYVLDDKVTTIEIVNALKQEQIKSINILKESAGAALYGTLGRNGVVIIKTNFISNKELVKFIELENQKKNPLKIIKPLNLMEL